MRMNLTKTAWRLGLAVLAVAAMVGGSGNAENGFLTSQAKADTLDSVKARGLLRCGVVNSGVGVSEISPTGRWAGFFPDFCRSVAAAVLGDSEAVEFVEVDYVVRFEALQSGAFDILSGNTTWTTSRDVTLGLAFTHPLFYDGQGFLAHRSLGASNLEEAIAVSKSRPVSVCVSEGTTTIRNLRDLQDQRGFNLDIKSFMAIDNAYSAFLSRECEMVTQDRVALVALRANRASNPSGLVLFPDVISKEPLGPAVRQDDQKWFDLVQWIIFATMIAEEHDLTQSNVDAARDSSDNPEVQALLKDGAGFSTFYGIPEDWAFQAIRQVGSYKEIYAKNLGDGSALGLERGLNALWTMGGLMYAPPLR